MAVSLLNSPLTRIRANHASAARVSPRSNNARTASGANHTNSADGGMRFNTGMNTRTTDS